MKSEYLADRDGHVPLRNTLKPSGTCGRWASDTLYARPGFPQVGQVNGGRKPLGRHKPNKCHIIIGMRRFCLEHEGTRPVVWSPKCALCTIAFGFGFMSNGTGEAGPRPYKGGRAPKTTRTIQQKTRGV